MIAAGAVIYLLFVVACFRLAWMYHDERGLSTGEGLFTLLGGVALCRAWLVPRYRSLVVLAGTLPLVGWFIATPYNSGPPFLVTSLVAPVISALAGAVVLIRRAT